jgi:acyl carrier protein
MMIRKIQALLSKVTKAKIREDEADMDVGELSSMERKIKAVMANVFKIDINDIDAETSADNVDQWTSLEHVDLLLNLQKEFDIEFTDSQLVVMLDYTSVVQNVSAALKDKKN